MDDFDSHVCSGQNALAQPHLDEADLASGVEKVIRANMGLLVVRNGCKVIRHGKQLLTTLNNNINYPTNYDNKQY